MMTIDQILTKLDHYYKEDQLTEVEPFLLSCLEDAKKDSVRSMNRYRKNLVIPENGQPESLR